MKKINLVVAVFFMLTFGAAASDSKLYLGFDMGYSFNMDDKFTNGPAFSLYGTYYFNNYLGVTLSGYTNEFEMDKKELYLRALALGLSGRYELAEWVELAGSLGGAYVGSSQKVRDPAVHPENTFGLYADFGLHFFPHEHYLLKLSARYFYAESDDKNQPVEYDFSHFSIVGGVAIVF